MSEQITIPVFSQLEVPKRLEPSEALVHAPKRPLRPIRLTVFELHEKWRDKIRGSQLINRLRNHVLGRIEMSPTQVRAAEILLRKIFPDLNAVEHSGEITQNYVVRLPAVIDNAEQWQQHYSPDPTIQ